MLSFLYVYSDHSILECYNLFSGVELSMRSFCVICTNCLQGFTLELSRDEHYAYCIDNETVRVEMPSKGSTIEFYDGQNQFKVPFMMYADFE